MKRHHNFGVSFYIRQNKNKTKDYSIYACIKAGGTVRELCIRSGLKKDDWNEGKGRPKEKNDELIMLSLYLDTVKSKLLNICLDLELNAGILSAENVRNIYLDRKSTHYTLLQLIDKATTKYEKEIEKGSLKNYKATKSYVEAFCKIKYKSGDVPLRHLTYAFIDELKTYILNHPLKPNNPCHSNGCMKHMARLKKIMAWAYEMRFVDRDVFASYKIKIKRHESEILHWEQLKTLENKVLQRPMLNLVRDLFVFCCYTGMAPIDMQRLRPHQIYSGIDGLTWLTYTRVKSNVSANVPLLSPAIELIRKYKLKEGDILRDTVFPFVTNKDLNDNLKIIGEICEFRMPLHFYMARHTFATTVTLLQGVPITSIQEMLGHEKIESTMIYTRTSNPVVGMDMMLVQQKMDIWKRLSD
ncbi:site-specific integrase [uncultured Chitinophaga sp.]|jgi:Site-specific recombinase XerD|uniref:site-specific integrase n=1 Tax=uncultured Chitinophaga sp. TaxID=339340 RepID=UPI002619BCF5|nr:site-specific integrase [uncultured Chitinophaga sp.]